MFKEHHAPLVTIFYSSKYVAYVCLQNPRRQPAAIFTEYTDKTGVKKLAYGALVMCLRVIYLIVRYLYYMYMLCRNISTELNTQTEK